MMPREGFYAARFWHELTPAYREFLALQDSEVHHPWARNSALLIPLTTLAGRISAWENYLVHFPDSPFAVTARDYYQVQLDALLYGTARTPSFSTEERGVAARHCRGHARLCARTSGHNLRGDGCPRAGVVYRRTPAQDTGAHRRIGASSRGVQPDTRVELLSTHGGQHLELSDRRGREHRLPGAGDLCPRGRIQFGVQSAGDRARYLYEVRDTAVVLVYQEDHATGMANRLCARSNVVEVLLRAPLGEGRTWSSNNQRFEIRRVNVPHVALCRLYPSTIEVVRTAQAPSARNGEEIHDFYAPGIGLVESRNETAGTASDTLLGSYTPGR